jgi:hypothetical protein
MKRPACSVRVRLLHTQNMSTNGAPCVGRSRIFSRQGHITYREVDLVSMSHAMTAVGLAPTLSTTLVIGIWLTSTLNGWTNILTQL